MGRKLKLTESELHKVIRRIVEQSDDMYYRITPEDYLDMMKYASYNGDVFAKMKKYGGKPLYIEGSLDLSGLPVTNLGPIAYVDGKLDISRTKVSNIGDLKAKSYISDYGSPREKLREKAELERKKSEMDSIRGNDEWNVKTNTSGVDDVGLKANALLLWLEDEGDIKVLDEDDKEKLSILIKKKEDLESHYEDEDRESDPDENLKILNTIEEIEEEIDELTSDVADVYDLHPKSYDHYGLQEFEVLVSGFKDRGYTVGTYEEMDGAALEYAKGYVDEVGVEGFSEGFIEDYLDIDAIVDMAREDYEYQIRDYPDGYFSEEDFELTPEQEERKEQLESEIEIYEERLMDIEDSDSTEYEQTQDHIDSLQEELDNIEVDTEPTEDMIDNKVEEYLYDVRRDPLDYLKNLGIDVKEYVDIDSLAEGLVNTDGWGIMSSYDGNYDEINFNGTDYYIMRIN